MSTAFLEPCVFLCDVDSRLFINPRTGNAGLPVTEHPSVLLGSNVTLKFLLTRNGVPIVIPDGAAIIASLAYRDACCFSRPFYTAPAVRLAGEDGAVIVSYDLTSEDKAGLQPGPLWLTIFIDGLCVLKDRGAMDRGPWLYPLPPTPYQETHILVGADVTEISLRPTPTLFVFGQLEEGVVRNISFNSDALTSNTLYECNRILFQASPEASFSFEDVWRMPLIFPSDGWWTYRINRYPDGSIAVDTETGLNGEVELSPEQVDYLLTQLPDMEVVDNKTQEIDTEEPSADKYPSEAATVTYVSGQVSSLNTAISGKVDKEAGKVLSDNNFTTAEKNKLESALTSVPDASTTVKGLVQIATGEEVTDGEDTVKAVVPATLKTELDKKANTSAIPDITGKVDKVEGKALSSNDFTDAYKTKVNADVESVTALPAPAVGLLNRAYFLTAADGTKAKGTIWKCVADGESYIFQQIQTDLSDLTDSTEILSGKVDKVTGYGLSKNDYTDDDKAAVGKIDLETLTELTGADVTVAPWTQSKWSASGTCSLTATGWAASGRQTAYIVITLAAGSTPSVVGTEAVAEDDALSAAGVYECFLKNVDGKIYFRQISFTEAVA